MKLLRGISGTLALLAIGLAAVAAGWLVFQGRWPHASAFEGYASGYLCSLVVMQLVTRASRRRRGGGIPEGELRTRPEFTVVWNNDSNAIEGSWDVILQDAGVYKISVIKAIATNSNLGIRHAKELVDQVPCALLANVPDQVASAAASILRESGALVIVQPTPQPGNESEDESA